MTPLGKRVFTSSVTYRRYFGLNLTLGLTVLGRHMLCKLFL